MYDPSPALTAVPVEDGLMPYAISSYVALDHIKVTLLYIYLRPIARVGGSGGGTKTPPGPKAP